MEITLIEATYSCLVSAPSKTNINLAKVKAFILSKNQKVKEYSFLCELCLILLYQDNFGIKYEVK